MPQFKISSAEMYQAAQDEAAVARNLGRIEGEIQSILNTLSMNSASATRIKQSLRSEIQSVSNVRQKLWVLSSALEEITKIYESAEKNVIGKNLDEMKNGRLSEKAVRLSNELRELGRTLGVERSGTYSGDPVNMCNGNYIYEKALFNLNTPMQMRFRIFYNIQNQNVGIFGRGWTHTYDIQLHFENDRISMCRDDASQMVFMRAKDGGWESLHGTFGVLKEDEQQGYSVTDRYECTYVFDRGGRLLREIDAMGNSFCLVYDTNGRLEKAEDKYGNFLSFHYNLAGEIDQLSDHTGRTAEFIYINGHLSSVKDAQGRITKYNYDSNGWLTGLENARGTELLKNGYDQQGRTLKQVFPDGGEIRYSYLDSRNQVEMTEQNGNTVIYEHDALYRNVRNIYQDGEEHFTYNDDNLRTSFTDKRGNTSYFAYNDQGNMTEFRNPLGDRVQLEYTQHGQIKTAVLNGIVMYQASYNENNRQESVENALGAKEYFEYDEYGYPSVWIRADGSRILMEHNCQGDLVSITNSMGGKTVYEYDNAHRVVKTTDALGNITRYYYDEADEIVRVVNSNGDEQLYEYDVCGNMVRARDFNGAETKIEYNVLNKPAKIIDAEGRIHLFEYDESWNIKKEIAADGGERLYEYDKLHRLIRVTDANGAVNEMSYDSCGNLIKRIDPNGSVHEIEYDALNRPKQVTDPCGRKVKAVYDPLGNVTEVQYEDGSAEYYTYDLLGNMISAIDRAGYAKYYAYDLLGNLQSVSDDYSVMEKYEYYPGGLTKKQILSDGSSQQFEYDANENIICITNQDGNQWHFSYDSLGRVVCAENDRGFSESYEYDAMGNIISVTDGEGNRRSYTYSKTGEIKSVTDGIGNETRYVYDRCRRLIQILQPENGCFEVADINEFNQKQKNIFVTAYRRDLVGNIISITDSDGNETSYTYDLCGNILSRTDPDGLTTRCEYNPDGTKKQYLFADGRDVKLTYNALKQLIQMEDWTGITKIQPDINGRPESVVTPDGDAVLYEWGLRGERKSVTYPDGNKVQYVYDAALRLTECVCGGEKIKYAYYPNGKLREKQLPGTFRTDYSYDTAGRITEISHRNSDRILARYLYQYDRIDRKVKTERVCEGVEGSGTYEYRYNPAGELLSVSRDGTEIESYAYDTRGNRIWSKVRGIETSYEYNRLNQLTCMEDNFGKHSFSYDARGNQIEEKLNDFLIWNASYNALGFLESMWFENKCKNFIYNGFGNRIGCCTISDGVTCGEQTFAYDITKEYQNLLSLKAENSWVDYLWDDGIIGEIENDRRQYYLHDELMSPQYVIQNRQMTAGIQYDTFGNIVDSFGEPPVFGFIGYQKGAGGFYHAEVREYSPKTGRFLNRDAFPGMIVLPLTLNAYVYSLNDPINYYDPSGYIVAWLAGGIIGAVTNVVTKVAGDIVNSVKSRKLQVSSWQSYVGTATGGFASGSILVVSGGNMKAAGAAGSAVETFVSEGLSMATGAEGYRKEDDYSWKNLVSNTAISAGEGLASGFVFGNVGKHIKIQGINKGRGSFQAVWKQVMTKASKGQIVNVTWKTIGKGAIAYGGVNFFDQIIQKGISEAKNGAEAGLRKVVTDLISEKPPAQRVFEEMAGRKYGDSKDNRPSSYLGGGTKMPVCLT